MENADIISKRVQSEHNAMRNAGIELINKIIEAEKNARKLAEEAYEERETMRSELDNSTEDLRREYFAKADARIQKIHEQNTAFTEERMAELDENYKRDLARIESAFEQNSDKWADQLFRIIIGRD